MRQTKEDRAGGAGVLDNFLAALEPDWSLVDPNPGSALGAGVTLYYDAGARSILLRKFGGALQLTIYQFEGSYVSLAVDVPEAMRARLRPGWRLVVRLHAETIRPTTTFLRLNLSHRHHNSVLHELAVLATGPRQAVFDLDAEVPDWSSAWLDVIFSHPRMTEIRISDLSLGFEEI